MEVRKLLMVSCAFVLVLVSACSNGSSSTQEPKESVTTSASPSPGSGKKELDFDMGGRVLKMVSWVDESIKGDTPDNVKKLANLEALKKKHNFDLQYVQIDYGQVKDKVAASLIAGEPIGDMVRMARGWMIPSLTKLDLFWPVDEYTSNRNVFTREHTEEYSQYKGRGYGFFTGINASAKGIIYNRTLMNKLGLKPLQEYVKEDKWNWETFMKVAKEGSKDTNNDGKLDTWGLASVSFNNLLASVPGANFVIDGKSGLENPKTLEVLNFFSRLATEKVARPKEGGDWTEPKQFFVQGNTLMYFGAEFEMEALNKDMKDYDLGFLPTPKGPGATTYNGFVTAPNYLAIPKNVKDPDKILYLYEKIYDIDSIYDYPHQAQFEKNFKTEDDINNAKETVKNVRSLDVVDNYPNMPYYAILDELNKGISVSTVVEKYKAQMDSAIAELWNQ